MHLNQPAVIFYASMLFITKPGHAQYTESQTQLREKETKIEEINTVKVLGNAFDDIISDQMFRSFEITYQMNSRVFMEIDGYRNKTVFTDTFGGTFRVGTYMLDKYYFFIESGSGFGAKINKRLKMEIQKDFTIEKGKSIRSLSNLGKLLLKAKFRF